MQAIFKEYGSGYVVYFLSMGQELTYFFWIFIEIDGGIGNEIIDLFFCNKRVFAVVEEIVTQGV